MEYAVLIAILVGLVLIGMMTTYRWGHEAGYNEGLTDAAQLIEDVGNMFLGNMDPLVKDVVREIERRKDDEE